MFKIIISIIIVNNKVNNRFYLALNPLYHSLISLSSYLVFFFRYSMSSWVKWCFFCLSLRRLEECLVPLCDCLRLLPLSLADDMVLLISWNKIEMPTMRNMISCSCQNILISTNHKVFSIFQNEYINYFKYFIHL